MGEIAIGRNRERIKAKIEVFLSSLTNTHVLLRQMRQFFAIPILIFYTLSMCGVMVYAHYCCASSVTVSFAPKGEACGGCAGCGKTQRGCCEDKVITFKTVQDQETVSPFRLKSIVADIILPTPIVYAPEQAVQLPTERAIQYMPNAPPGRWQNIPLYKLHARLTYYG